MCGKRIHALRRPSSGRRRSQCAWHCVCQLKTEKCNSSATKVCVDLDKRMQPCTSRVETFSRESEVQPTLSRVTLVQRWVTFSKLVQINPTSMHRDAIVRCFLFSNVCVQRKPVQPPGTKEDTGLESRCSSVVNLLATLPVCVWLHHSRNWSASMLGSANNGCCS
jgi:hypothetical protein